MTVSYIATESPLLAGLQNLTWQFYPDTVAISGENDYTLFPVQSWTTGKAEGIVAANTGPGAIIRAGGGGAYDYNNDIMYNNGGGHNDSAANDFIKFDCRTGKYTNLRIASTEWTDYLTTPPYNGNYPAGWPAVTGPYTFGDPQPYMPDGTRPSVHSYGGLVHISDTEIYCFGGSLAGGTGEVDVSHWKFNQSTAEWEGVNIFLPPGVGLGAHMFHNYISGTTYMVRGGFVGTVDRANGIYNTITTTPATLVTDSLGGGYDPTRQKILMVGQKISAGGPSMWEWDCVSGNVTEIPQTTINSDGPGGDYVPEIDRYVFWTGGNTLYTVHPDTYAIGTIALSGVAPTKTPNGMFGRFRWSSNLQRFIVQTSYEENVHYIPFNTGGF